MTAAIETEQELIEEALSILSKNLPPHKVARLLSIWHIGKGDYLKDRDAEFAGEKVVSLFEKALQGQSE
ncbi:MAG: hypothetical protein KDK97_08070 [Verrucomicrobiales bacterium]|nr:hypothetical protein [Verrucomicrobiales bacterium]